MNRINLKKIRKTLLEIVTTPTRLYFLDKKTLNFIKIKPILLVIIFGLPMLLTYFIGYHTGVVNMETRFGLNGRGEVDPIKDGVWMDSVFTDYKQKCDLYLGRTIFTGTPLTGELLSTCARNSYEKYGVIVPVELVLAQAQFETSMGREGRSPRTNPFNIGEWDEKTVKWFTSTFDGTQEYFTLISNKYLKCKNVNELLINFTNCNGSRYASSDYEEHINKQYFYIKKWLENNKK